MEGSEYVTVFTVAEHSDLFRIVVGSEADIRINPFETVLLDHELGNIARAGGRLVILDESHFFGVEHLAEGLKLHLDRLGVRPDKPRIVLFCPQRKAGDRWLGFFAGYLDIYDIVYDADIGEAALKLAGLLRRRNERSDVLGLLESAFQPPEPERVHEPVEQAGSLEPVYEVVVNGVRVLLRIEAEPLKG